MLSQKILILLLSSMLAHTAPTADSGSGTAALYGQCGGSNWSGATQCADGATCVSQNPYYSQCIQTDGGSNDAASTTKVTTAASSTATAAAHDQSTASSKAGTVAAAVASDNSGSSTGTESDSESASQSSNSNLSSSLSSSSSSNSSSGSNIQTVSGGVTGSNGKTTYYWDCCSPSFVWAGQYSSLKTAVIGCDSNDKSLEPANTLKSGCESGGNTFSCSDQHAFSISDDLAYGFAAGKLTEMTTDEMACTCFNLTFTSSAIAGKQMVVQVTNTGEYSDDHHFDLAMPGGGVGGYPDGCTNEFGSGYTWGKTYGGISSLSDCDNIPEILQEGCRFRFQWLQGADNPTVSYEQVVCPSELTSISGCTRNDE
ncbi:unnamed protein product [Ambrosiozyma monospora]|uniref:Unnamed protein product n=1 Tax=Ambrosiozyma monospora TaxID=43982 RepID=A0ACB5SRW6_AMBMO|nr:unnamed protein product [Ambrosiozyma monospora]